jgi:hypothetical protein
VQAIGQSIRKANEQQAGAQHKTSNEADAFLHNSNVQIMHQSRAEQSLHD